MDHQGMNTHSAGRLQGDLEPLLPDYVVTSAPWRSERGEWIVTVWDEDDTPLIDVYERGGRYLLRRVGGRRRLVGDVASVAEIPAAVRAAEDVTR